MEAKEEKKSKIKKVLKAVANYSAIVWAVCVLAVGGILAVATRFLTYDPNFTNRPDLPRGAEAGFTEPMLVFFFVGLGAFGLMLVSGVSSLLIKGKTDFKAPLGLSLKKIFLGMGAFFVALSIFFYGFRQANLGKFPASTITAVPTFTGQELFDAVNAYRKENGIKEVKLDPNVCNNLAQRYLDIKKGVDEGVAHKGFEDWIEKYIKPLGGYYISEDIAQGASPQDVIKQWAGSPGHRLSILDPKATLGCSYAAEGWAIIELGYRQSYTQKAVSQNQTPSRTGAIIPYHEWCLNKDISIYENELITKKSTDGNVYTMTEGDWSCYENYLKSH